MSRSKTPTVSLEEAKARSRNKRSAVPWRPLSSGPPVRTKSSSTSIVSLATKASLPDYWPWSRNEQEEPERPSLPQSACTHDRAGRGRHTGASHCGYAVCFSKNLKLQHPEIRSHHQSAENALSVESAPCAPSR